jgi:hypothetical protein
VDDPRHFMEFESVLMGLSTLPLATFFVTIKITTFVYNIVT